MSDSKFHIKHCTIKLLTIMRMEKKKKGALGRGLDLGRRIESCKRTHVPNKAQ